MTGAKICCLFLTKALSLVRFKSASHIMLYRGRMWLGQVFSDEGAGCVKSSSELGDQYGASCMSRRDDDDDGDNNNNNNNNNKSRRQGDYTVEPASAN